MDEFGRAEGILRLSVLLVVVEPTVDLVRARMIGALLEVLGTA